jgi:hypothetical protein
MAIRGMDSCINGMNPNRTDLSVAESISSILGYKGRVACESSCKHESAEDVEGCAGQLVSFLSERGAPLRMRLTWLWGFSVA